MAGTIENRFSALLAAKARSGGQEKISLYQVADATGLAWSTVKKWAADEVERFDKPTLATICEYFDCQPGDLLTFTPARGRRSAG